MKPFHVSETANASLQNRINVSIVFHHIREYGPLYRAEIARDLKLSAPAVSRAVEALKGEGYVIETGKVRTQSGKRAAHVMVSDSYGWVIGIDLLKEPTKVATANLQCAITEVRDGFLLDDSVDVRSELVSEIESIIERHGRADELKAIAVGVPAVIDEFGSVAGAFLYASLEGQAIREVLEEHFGVPTFVDNGANLSALAEAKHGQGRNCRNFVFVEISNGIGAGLVIDRNVVRGGHGSAGEIGFTLMSPSNSGRGARGFRYLEEEASVDALRRHAIEALRAGRAAPVLLAEAGGSVEGVTASAVCSAALAGDALSRELLTMTTDALSVAVRNLAIVLDPERIILGGDICHLPGAESLFADPIRQKLRDSIPFAVPEVILSSLRESAGVIGGAQLAVDALLTRMYPYSIDEQAERA